MKMKNEVQLLGYYGGDKTHCQSAWCSTYQELDLTPSQEVKNIIPEMFDKTKEMKQKTPDELLSMLASSGHETPFEKSFLHFQLTMDIASHIHLIKHRINVSVNSESQRYKQLKSRRFQIPEDWPKDEKERHLEYCNAAYDEYERMLSILQGHFEENGMSRMEARKRAKESARYKLPYSVQQVCDVSFNWRSFYHFIKLRYSVHAQKEIRDMARDMILEVMKLDDFELTLKAFGVVDEKGKQRKPYD